MPRAFLITNRRYSPGPASEDQTHSRDNSPERCVNTAESPTDLSITSQVYSSYGDLPLTISLPDSPHSPANMSRDTHYMSEADSPQVQPLGLTVHRRSSSPTSGLFATSLLGSSAIAAVLQRVMGARPPPTPPPSPEDGLPEPYGCPECGKRYTTSSNLARHRQTHRSPLDKKARKCPHCDKVYVSMPAYSMHVRTHSQGCQCPFCGKRFSRPWLLQGHIRTHTGEKPFSCPVCAKAFADKSNLRAHVQTHSATKPFVCGRCGKAFALKSYLYKHEESSCMKVGRETPKSSPDRDTSSPSMPSSPMMMFQHSDESI